MKKEVSIERNVDWSTRPMLMYILLSCQKWCNCFQPRQDNMCL